MKDSEFKKLLKNVSLPKGGKRLIDISLVANLDKETKIAMTNHIVRNRMPVITAFLNGILTPDYDSWLHCMGYSYIYENNGFEFRGTQGHWIHYTGKCS